MFRAALISMFLTSAALADTWTVDDDGKADFDNIQAAIDASSDGDEILVMPGTYTSTQDGHVVNMLGKAVWLHSSDGTEVTIISGEGARRGLACFNNETSKTIISGFTITNGFSVEFDYNGDGDIDWWEDSGGGMLNYGGNPTLTDCTFTDNTTNNNGGAIYNSSSNPTLTNCTFENNTASNHGGGMYNYSSSHTLTNCTFDSNAAYAGGGMYNFGSSPTMPDCTFTNNTAVGTNSKGGGMFNDYDSSPTLIDCTFENNTASSGGGMSNDDNSNPTLTNCIFEYNTATAYGGGMYNRDNSNPTLNNGCTFTNNTANYSGGMYNNNSSPTLTNCTFENNTATYQGGGMLNYYSSPTLTNCTFDSNTAYHGGGMYNYNYSNPAVTNCTFTSNTAANQGGGMYNRDNSNPTLNNGCTFTNNTASYGGGMFNYNNSSPTLTDCTFTNNFADENGGGMYNYNYSSPTLTDCTFTNNTATIYGGGMYNFNSSSPTLMNCSLTGNSATTGDGIYNTHDSSTHFIGTNTSDELYISYVSSLDFGAESTCDVFGSTFLSSDGTISFDIDDIETSSSLNVSQSIDQSGGLVISNDSGSLLEATKENIGDRIPLAQASTLTGNFDSIVFPPMPEGLGLQLINPALRGGGSEVAAEVIEVEGANFGDPFSGGLDSPPIDIISFDADGDGRDEVAVLFGGTPGGVAGYSVSQDGTPTPIDGLVAIVGNDPVSIDAADLNNDGREDLIVANSTDNSISVLLTMEDIDGSLYFDVTTTPMPRGGQSITCVAAIDWDNDSGLDAVVGIDGVNNGYQVLLNVSDTMTIGPWLEIPEYEISANSYVPDPPTCVDGGDQSSSWGFVGGTRYGRVHRAAPGGSLQVIAELEGNNTVTIEAIELDASGGDGQIDLMVSSDEAEMIYLFQGNATEADGFDDLIPLGVSLPVEDIIALDADGDGDKDIVMTAPDSTSSPLTLLRNDGAAGGFVGSLTGITWSMQNINTKTSPVKVASGNLDDKGEDDDYIIGSGSSTAFRGEPTGTLEQSNILLGPQCDADVSGDGEVNVTDLLAVIDQWGLTNSPADINADGIVDVTDLLMVVGNWGPCE